MLKKPEHEGLAVRLSQGVPIRQAAEELGLSLPTAYRWSRRGDIMARVRELQGAATAAAISSLRDSLGAAVATLTALMEDAEIPPSVRCSAAAKLLEQGLRAVEIGEILQRLEALEQKTQNGGSGDEE